MFVELERLAVDGLVHVSDLEDDFYHHDPVAHTLVGERSGRRFRLGDALEVRLLRVDEEALQIQLGVVGMRPEQRAGRRGERRRTAQRR
jgi:ribonuclease R